MPQDKKITPEEKAHRTRTAKKAVATRTANKEYRVVLEAIAKSEKRLASVIAESEARIQKRLGEIDRSIAFLAESLLHPDEREGLKRAAVG